MSGDALTKDRVHVSGVIPAPIDRVWATVSRWTEIESWMAPLNKELNGGLLRSRRLEDGPAEGQVGCQRAISLNEGVYVEELTAIDSNKFILRHCNVNHPAAVNPYPGPFLDNLCTLRLYEITQTRETLVSWSFSYTTAVSTLEPMHKAIKGGINAGVQGLQALFAPQRQPPQPLGRSGNSIGQTRSSETGSRDGSWSSQGQHGSYPSYQAGHGTERR